MSQQLKFYRGNENNLVNVSPEDGALYHCEDTGNTYLGNDTDGLSIYSTSFTYSEAESDAVVPINADTLNGMSSSDFTTPNQVNNSINKAMENVAYIADASEESSLILADAESLGGIPASNYATKAYVSNAIANAQLGGGD